MATVNDDSWIGARQLVWAVTLVVRPKFTKRQRAPVTIGKHLVLIMKRFCANGGYRSDEPAARLLFKQVPTAQFKVVERTGRLAETAQFPALLDAGGVSPLEPSFLCN